MSDALKRALRTLAQLVVSGALTATVNDLAVHLTPTQKVLVLAGWQVVVTLAQNALENAAVIPTVGRPPAGKALTGKVQLLPEKHWGTQQRLGWHRHQDPRSRSYALSSHPAFDPNAPIKRKRWGACRSPLNQGNLGSCTGNAETRALAEMPGHTKHTYDEAFARKLYSAATQIDQVPGQWPPTDTGSTTVGVLKAAQKLGYIGSYRWAFSIEELLWTLSYIGPAIIGIPWLSANDHPDNLGTIVASGTERGGHEVCADEVIPDPAAPGGGWIGGWQSWGPYWPNGGRWRMSWADWRKFAAMGAECGVGLS